MVRTLFAILFSIYLVGCCTIMSGTKQEIGISSKPTGATVIIDNIEYGNTPIAVELSRKDIHTVEITTPGYQPYETILTRGTNDWVWGNIIFGVLIGLAVDVISGSLYKLEPSNVEGALTISGASNQDTDDLVVIMFTLKPDPEWEKIGELIPIGR